MNKLPFALLALLAMAACGGNVVSESTGGGTTGTGAGTTTTTGTGATTSTGPGAGGGVPVGPCPPSPPVGQSCAGAPAGLRCTYGDSVRPDCREEWKCLGGNWVTQKDCAMPPPGVCGSSEPAPGTMCPGMGDECVYGESFCYCGCGGGFCGMPLEWQCADPPTTADCPPTVPNDGTPCLSPGLECTYGNVCTPAGAMVDCTNGFWVWNTMIACGG